MTTTESTPPAPAAAPPATFEQYGFSEPVLRAVKELGFATPTEVQKQSFDPVLDGNDVVVQSKTGSGKTAGFGLPMIEALGQHDTKGVRALVLCPTRELAKQVFEDLESYAKYTDLQFACVYGGVGMEPQIRAIEQADCVVGTPGRVLDHLSQGTLELDDIVFLVLDEADRMLDMGFIDDVRRVIAGIKHDHVTMMFSATMPTEILGIAETMMHDPVHIKCESFVSDVHLKQYVVKCSNRTKLPILREIIAREKPELAIVFCATRGLTDHVAEYLQASGLEAKPLHGGHTQAKRENILDGFHAGTVHVLVATDVAARGLDISGVTHVFNYNVPKTPQEYTHRMGRTARAGKDGKAFTLLAPTEYEDYGPIDSYFRDKIEEFSLGEFNPRPVSIPKRDSAGGFSSNRGPQGRDRGRNGDGGGFRGSRDEGRRRPPARR
jgi:ATP-dependent RNA helicase DeaD